MEQATATPGSTNRSQGFVDTAEDFVQRDETAAVEYFMHLGTQAHHHQAPATFPGFLA